VKAVQVDWKAFCQVKTAIFYGAGVSLGYLIFLIFACMSLTKTNTDEVISACGEDLYTIVTVDVIFGTVGFIFSLLTLWFAFCCINCCNEEDEDEIDCYSYQGKEMQENVALLYGIAFLILGALSLSRYVDASNKPGCFDVLSSTRNGMKSPSANLGDPLLANVALIHGILYTIVGFSSALVVIYNLIGFILSILSLHKHI
jgi:hypothetical protein